MRTFSLVSIGVATAVLSSCMTNPNKSCMRLSDPNPTIVSGFVQSIDTAPPGTRITRTYQLKDKNNGTWEMVNPSGGDTPPHMSSSEAQIGAAGAYLLLSAITPMLPNEECSNSPSEAAQTVYLYSVKGDNDLNYEVMSYFSGFEVGQCVKIFVSSDPSKYATGLASVGECKSS